MFLEFTHTETEELISIRKSCIERVEFEEITDNYFSVCIVTKDDSYTMHESKSKEEALKKYKELVEEISNENIKQPSAPATGFCIHVVSG